MKKLMDVCDIQYGYAFDSKKFSDDSSFIPLIRIRDVKRGYSETFYSGTYSKEYIVHRNDLLIGMDGEFNIARWSSNEALLNQRVCKIIAKNGTNEEYLRFAMSRKLKEIEEKTSFVTVKHLSAKELKKIILKMPNIEKQNKIANILVKLEDIIKVYKKELEKLNSLIQSRFVEMFGDLADPKCVWNKVKLINVCKTPNDVKCGPFGTQLNKNEYQKKGVAVWEIPQINDEFASEPIHFLTEKKAKILESYSVISGDIVMSRKGNIGKCAVFPDEYEKGIIHSDVLRIRVDAEQVNSQFMMRQLHYSRAIKHQIGTVSSGAIMAGINVTKLKQIYVHIPPIDLQNQFAAFVQQVNKSKFEVQKSLEKTQLLFDSLMQEYFG